MVIQEDEYELGHNILGTATDISNKKSPLFVLTPGKYRKVAEYWTLYTAYMRKPIYGIKNLQYCICVTYGISP
jgi:hypothetical protein